MKVAIQGEEDCLTALVWKLTGMETIRTITGSVLLIVGCLKALFNAVVSPCSRNYELTSGIKRWFLAKLPTSVRVLS